MPVDEKPRFFATPEAFRKWLHANHETKTELWVGFYKKDSGRPSITWPESVDEALCVGWIDGVRKSIDAESYKIRFTPRKAVSTWSAVNLKRMPVLEEEGRVLLAGHAAHERRKEERSGIYAYENRKLAKLDAASEKLFRANKAAWKYFSNTPPSYQQVVVWAIVTAKQEATRQRRLATLIAHSAAGEWLPGMRRTAAAKLKV